MSKDILNFDEEDGEQIFVAPNDVTNDKPLSKHTNINSQEIKGQARWSHDMVLLLLNNIYTRKSRMMGSIKKKEVFTEIEEIFKEKEHKISLNDLMKKWNNLKFTYRSICSRDRKNGKSENLWSYFDLMKSIVDGESPTGPPEDSLISSVLFPGVGEPTATLLLDSSIIDCPQWIETLSFDKTEPKLPPVNSVSDGMPPHPPPQYDTYVSASKRMRLSSKSTEMQSSFKETNMKEVLLQQLNQMENDWLEREKKSNMESNSRMDKLTTSVLTLNESVAQLNSTLSSSLSNINDTLKLIFNVVSNRNKL